MLGRALVAISAAALLLSGCGGGVERDARPAVWVVRDADTTLYLTGTVHLLPRNLDWRNGPIVMAMASADALVTELSPTEIAGAGKVARQYFYGTGSEPPADRFSPDLRDEYLTLAADELPTVPEMARLDDWALALLMAQAVAANAGLTGDNGMDSGLIEAFTAAGKPCFGIERAAEQFGYFDAIPRTEQRTMLNKLMQDIAAGRADDRLRATIDAWASGDVAALAALLARDADDAPVTRQLLLVERNRRWAEWVEQRMARPGTLLVAVGAGHLAGQESLITMLTARGLNASRLD